MKKIKSKNLDDLKLPKVKKVIPKVKKVTSKVKNVIPKTKKKISKIKKSSKKVIPKSSILKNKKVIKKNKQIPSNKIKKKINYKKEEKTIINKQSVSKISEDKSFQKKSFFKDYLKLVWIPILFLILVIFFDFVLNVFMNFNYSPLVITLFKTTLIYKIYMFLLIGITFVVYLIFAYEAVKHRFDFKKVLFYVLNLSLFFLIIDILLISITQLFFLKSTLLAFGFYKNIFIFLFLYGWSVIKSIILFCVFIIAYILFNKKKLK